MPYRSIVVIVSLALSAPAAAQCLPTAGLPVALANRDEALSAPVALGFTFPMAGAVGGPFTHAVVGTNGVVFLTTGSAATDASPAQHGSVAELRGQSSASPRLAPFWSDLWDAFFPGVDWSVTIDTTVPGRCAIVWRDCCEWPLDAPPVSFGLELFDSGAVAFAYGACDTGSYFLDAVVGVSVGNAIADTGPLDLSSAAASGTGLAYEVFAPGTFDLAYRTISFVPAGLGYRVTTSCQQAPASHASVGEGCYAHSDSLYQFFADASAAATALSGQSMQLLPTGSGYTVAWGGATFDPPSTPIVLPLTDDGEVSYVPSSPLPTPWGPAASLRVHENGVVSLGAAPQTFPGSVRYQPTPAAMLGAAAPAFWSWHDFRVDEPGSGLIKAEEKVVGADTMLYLTWDAVENYAEPELANPSSLQFQLNLRTGAVAIVWLTIDADASSQFGSAHLVGVSPAGPSPDGGSLVLATALPVRTTAAMFPLQLDADPAPVSTPTAGTLVTFTTSNLSEAAPGFGVYVGVHAIGFGPAPGVDLAGFGAPNCRAYLASLDIVTGMLPITPTTAITFFVPPGVPAGLEFWSQSICLVVPQSLPNGANAAGMTTSNGVHSIVAPF